MLVRPSPCTWPPRAWSWPTVGLQVAYTWHLRASCLALGTDLRQIATQEPCAWSVMVPGLWNRQNRHSQECGMSILTRSRTKRCKIAAHARHPTSPPHLPHNAAPCICLRECTSAARARNPTPPPQSLLHMRGTMSDACVCCARTLFDSCYFFLGMKADLAVISSPTVGPHVGQLFANCRSTVGQLQLWANCRQSVGQL